MSNIKTLASLKRHFENGGGAIVREYYYHGRPAPHKYMDVERRPTKCQKNGVYLGSSFLDYGKASEWTFSGNIATTENEFCRLVYELVA